MAKQSGERRGAGSTLPAIAAASFLAFALGWQAPAWAALTGEAATVRQSTGGPVTQKSATPSQKSATPTQEQEQGLETWALAAGTIYSLIPGYGLGHFLVGDHEGGMRFLALELGATALWMVGPSIVAVVTGSEMNTPTTASNVVFALGFLGHGGLKIWEVASVRSFVLKQPVESAGPALAPTAWPAQGARGGADSLSRPVGHASNN